MLERRQLLSVSASLTPPSGTNYEGSANSVGLAASSDDSSISGWQVDWGDGSSDSLDGSAASASHTYASAGNYNVAATASDYDPSSDTAYASIGISDAALNASSVGISGTVGTSFSGAVATLSDGNPLETGSNLAATVSWSDGENDDATLTSTGSGQFSVNDSRSFSSPGPISASVHITDSNGQTADATSDGTVEPASFSVGGASLSVQEGDSYSGSVGSIVDSSPWSSSANFSASYSLNGATYSASISGSYGNYSVDVSGIGPFDLSTNGSVGTVSVTEYDQTQTADGSVNVTDAPISASGIGGFSANIGDNWSGIVATVTDSDTLEDGTNLSATIAWSDGQIDNGWLQLVGGGVFNLIDSRSFSAAGDISGAISITDAGGSTATAGTDVTVSTNPDDPPPTYSFSISGGGITVQEGQNYTGAVGSLNDSDPNSYSGNFSASLSVNGTSYPVSVDGSGGYYSLDVNNIGPFDLADAGTANLHVDGPSESHDADVSVDVTDAPISASGNPNLSATVGQNWSDTVATINDEYLGEDGSHLSATVAWSDGVTDQGTLVGVEDGVFNVTDARVFNAAGPISAVVTINDSGGSYASANAYGTVEPTSFSVSGGAINVFESQSYAGIIGYIDDTQNPNSSAGNFSAAFVLNGITYPVTIDGSGGSYSLSVANVGPLFIPDNGATGTVTVNEDDQSHSADVPVSVEDAPLSFGPATVTAVEGQQYNGAVITFSDADPTESASNYSATITWGDGTVDAGTVTGNSGSFTVSGAHTYAEESNANNPYMLSVSVTDLCGGGSPVQSSPQAVQVDDAQLDLSSDSGDITAIEGQPFEATVLQFSDDDPEGEVGDYTASINWGDGTVDNNVGVSGTGGGFTVAGNHTYLEEGVYNVSITATDEGGSTVSDSTQANVADAVLTAGSGMENLMTQEGQRFTGTVLQFTDADPNGDPSDYTATIDWGDGTTDNAAVVADPQGNGFNVIGSHIYDEGNFIINVTVVDAGEPITYQASAYVTDAPLTAGDPKSVVYLESAPKTADVGTFSDENPYAPTDDFTATINWGDGQSSNGLVIQTAAGEFKVSGTHQYDEEAFYQGTIDIHDEGGSETTLDFTAAVAGPVNSTSDLPAADPQTSPLDGLANSDGDPEVTLRSAIQYVNAQHGGTIDFEIPNSDPGYDGSVWTIATAGEPTITAPTDVDGMSQPGYAGTPLVFISGGGTGLDFEAEGGVSAEGLGFEWFDTGIKDVNSQGSNGFSENSFTGVNTGISLDLSGDSTGNIADNYIDAAVTGLDATTNLSDSADLQVTSNDFEVGEQGINLATSGGGDIEIDENTLEAPFGNLAPAMFAMAQGADAGQTSQANGIVGSIDFTLQLGTVHSSNNQFTNLYDGYNLSGTSSGNITSNADIFSGIGDWAGIFDTNLNDGGKLSVENAVLGTDSNPIPNGIKINNTVSGNSTIYLYGDQGTMQNTALKGNISGTGTITADGNNFSGTNSNGAVSFSLQGGIGVQFNNNTVTGNSFGISAEETATATLSWNFNNNNVQTNGSDWTTKFSLSGSGDFVSAGNTYKNTIGGGVRAVFANGDGGSSITLQSMNDIINTTGKAADYQFTQGAKVSQKIANLTVLGAGVTISAQAGVSLQEDITGSKFTFTPTVTAGVVISVNNALDFNLGFSQNVMSGRGVTVDGFAPHPPNDDITGNSFSGITGAAIELSDGASQLIAGNTITGCAIGIEIDSGSSGDIEDNTIEGNSGDGVLLANGATATLSGNSIEGNGGAGIDVQASTSVDVTDNSLSGNDVDIAVGGSGGAEVTAASGSITWEVDSPGNTLAAGAGNTFVLGPNSGQTTITGFDTETDVLDLRNTAAANGDFTTLALTQQGSSTLVGLSDDSGVLLTGVVASTLNSGNFIFNS